MIHNLRRIGVVLAGAALVLAGNAIPSSAAPHITVLLDDLNNPRGLAFAPDDSVYIAEAGLGDLNQDDGPCFGGPEGDEVCFGITGSIARYRYGNLTRVFTGLPSLANKDGSAAIGPSDVTFAGRGLFTIGLGADPARVDELPPPGQFAGKLMSFDPDQPHQTLAVLADIAGFEASANPDGGEHDSNPQSVAVGGGRIAVADAGGNSLVRARNDGTVQTLAVFPDRTAPAPDFLGLPPGTMMALQSVPTGVVYHGGAFYLAELTGFPFPQGAARIHRVVPGQQPQVYAEGFTNLIDLAFGPNGDLYALEIAHDSLLAGEEPSGALWRVRPGKKPKLVIGGLNVPGGLAIKGKHAYLTDCSVCPRTGRLIRIKL